MTKLLQLEIMLFLNTSAVGTPAELEVHHTRTILFAAEVCLSVWWSEVFLSHYYIHTAFSWYPGIHVS